MPLYEYKCAPCGHQFEVLIMKSRVQIEHKHQHS